MSKRRRNPFLLQEIKSLEKKRRRNYFAKELLTNDQFKPKVIQDKRRRDDWRKTVKQELINIQLKED